MRREYYVSKCPVPNTYWLLAHLMLRIICRICSFHREFVDYFVGFFEKRSKYNRKCFGSFPLGLIKADVDQLHPCHSVHKCKSTKDT